MTSQSTTDIASVVTTAVAGTRDVYFDDAVASAIEEIIYRSDKRIDRRARGPLTIVLVGPPGTGKSFIAEHVAKLMGCQPYIIAASSLAGSTEGASSEAFEAACAEADGRGSKAGRPGVLVINDIGESNLAVNEQRGTKNQSLLINSVLCRADDKAAGRCTSVVIMTTNSTKDLPEALLRAGRAVVVNVNPAWRVRRRQLMTLLAGERTSARLAGELLMLLWPTARIAFLSSCVAQARARGFKTAVAGGSGEYERTLSLINATAAQGITGRALLSAALQLSVRPAL